MAQRYVYVFGREGAEGRADQRELLGGKGANLAEMCRLGLPVPPGFTITTEACTAFFAHGGTFPEGLAEEVEAALARVEAEMGAGFGDPERPLLLSCRSGARRSMPGMMETVLNLGLSRRTLPGLIARTGDARFAYDAYRRLLTMYADVVMEKAEGLEPPEGQGIRRQLERLLEEAKAARGAASDADLTAEDLEALCVRYEARIREVLGRPVPEDPREQLWGAIGAVFRSWNGKRAVAYRRIEGIPDDWGTAVNVQAMVFGNLGANSATGVAFTRNPATGENVFYGEWLPNAQGEDVVAGLRTPNPLNEATRSEHHGDLPSLEQTMPALYRELEEVRRALERRYGDMQDIEFTIQEGRLYVLQCRSGKRTGAAALAIALDLLDEGLIDAPTAVLRVDPAHLDQLLHPFVDPEAEPHARVLARGLPAGPGGAAGRVVFTAADAVAWAARGERVVLVREETSPEDIEGMRAAAGILTARGGMTSHAALVARGWGMCCVVGAGAVEVDPEARCMRIDGETFPEGTWITLNGTRGLVYEGELPMVDATENPRLQAFMQLVDAHRTIGVRANADTPEDARTARAFGAEGIGLFRTEHMFYGAGGEEPLFLLRRVILSTTEEERREALEALFPHVRDAVRATLEAMEGLPVTIRLLDPPLHEFVPHTPEAQAELAQRLELDPEEVRRRCEALRETNPMMGHRGVRLGITYPEITAMQLRAVLEAAATLRAEGRDARPELMVPVTCDPAELRHQRALLEQVRAEVPGAADVPLLFGTMIETPRACLVAEGLAAEAAFFSFGTNDLTQLAYGFSRDDVGAFLPHYLERGVLRADPFQTLDRAGVGALMRAAVERGRAGRADLKIGLCGEHGGDPASVALCVDLGLDYVSCSPYRVPIARLAAAQAAVRAGLVAADTAGARTAA